MNKIKMDLTKELPYAVEESINRLRINVSFLGNEIKKISIVLELLFILCKWKNECRRHARSNC